jgi:hypothetical protein
LNCLLLINASCKRKPDGRALIVANQSRRPLTTSTVGAKDLKKHAIL